MTAETDPYGLPAIVNWSEVKGDITNAVEALAAALHREKHPSWRLDGFSCPCYGRAETLIGWLSADTEYRVETGPDVLDGARAEYRECFEVRRLLGYLWMATGKNHLRPVHDLFAEDDPIVADVERLAIFPEPVA